MLVWRQGNIEKKSCVNSIVYYYNDAQRYEQFLQVGQLYRALILLGLALYLPSASASSDLCIRLTWNLISSCGQQQRLHELSRKVVKLFQDGGRPPFWKSIYRHISVKNHRIFMKFCTQQRILNWMNVTWSKMKKLHWTDSEFDRTYFLILWKFWHTRLHFAERFGCLYTILSQTLHVRLNARPNQGTEQVRQTRWLPGK